MYPKERGGPLFHPGPFKRGGSDRVGRKILLQNEIRERLVGGEEDQP